MNNQFKLTDNLTPRSIKPSYHYRLILIITFLLVALGAGYFSWRQIQLYLAQQLIHDCVEQHNCANNRLVRKLNLWEKREGTIEKSSIN